MKKILLLIICIFLLPITVFARTATKEDLILIIDSFENIQVDDNIRILSMNVEKNQIEVTLLENDLPEIRYIPYSFENNAFSFQGGEYNKKTKELKDNQYAFYLYSILESKSTASYEEENYYNPSLILKRVGELKEKKKTYQNWGKTFGLTLEEKENQNISITYHYYLDGNDIIGLNSTYKNGEFTNPETGYFSTYVTVTLLLIIGVAGYTVWNKDNKGNN